MAKTKIKLDSQYGYLIINGEHYEVDNIRGKPTFKKIDMQRVKDKVKKVEAIAEKLKTKLDAKAVIKESVMRISLKDIDRLYCLLFVDKKNYKAKTREHHCVDMTVGNFIIPIVD